MTSAALFMLALIACRGGGEPDEPKGDPVLVRACNYIQGGGFATVGGEGGAIVIVDRLDDEVDPNTNKPIPGTLRHACEMGEARTVLFSVAGTIHLKKPLELTRGNITIAGQSAPGEGICLADYPLIIKNAENVIIRFIRVRLGNESLKKDKETDYDAISVNDCKNVVLDHVSASWSVDECVSCYGNENFTMQYCFVTESLRDAGHVKGAHGYGGIWGGKNATFHHNLLAHHDSRNPRFDHDYVSTMAGPIDFVNNVVYNWGGNSAYGGEGNTKGGGGRLVNFVANYYKAGPSTNSGVRDRLLNPWLSCSNCSGKYSGQPEAIHVYLEGNAVNGSDAGWNRVSFSGGATEAMCRCDTRHAVTHSLAQEQTAVEAFETVLVKGGCSYRRDALDTRIVSDVRQGKGKLINTPADAGGWPNLKSGTPDEDMDGDGIPDEWELAHNMNPRSYKDAKEKTIVSTHTNLEVYLCDIVKDLY